MVENNLTLKTDTFRPSLWILNRQAIYNQQLICDSVPMDEIISTCQGSKKHVISKDKDNKKNVPSESYF